MADWITLGILALVLLMLFSLKTAVSRIEARLNRMQQAPENKMVKPRDGEDSDEQESAFEQFLAEDAARLGMSKSEQFAAYRQWRKDKGMNWSS